MRDPRAVAAFVASLMMTAPAAANEMIDWHGFVEPEARAYIDQVHPRFTDSSRPDAGLTLNAYPSDWADASGVAELDLRYADVATPAVEFDLRELWVRLYKGPFTFSMGKQIFGWGTVDEFGVVDILNPQELPDLAQDLANRKLGVWAAKGAWDFGFMVAEAYLMPFFQPAEIPSSGLFAEATLPRPVERAIEADLDRQIQAGSAAEAELTTREAELEEGLAELEEAQSVLAASSATLDRKIAETAAQKANAEQDGNTLLAQQLEATLDQLEAASAQLERQRSELDRRYAELQRNHHELSLAREQLAGDRESGRRRFEQGLASPRDVHPAAEPINTQWALRLYAPLDFGDIAVGVARLYDQIGTLRYRSSGPEGEAPELLRTFPKLTAWTLEGAFPIEVFTLNVEAIYMHTADPDGTDPFLRNPTIQTAAQASFRLSPEWQLRFGSTDEFILHMDDPVERADERSLPNPVGSALTLLDPHLVHTALQWRFSGLDQVTLAYLWAYEADGHFIAPEVDYTVIEGLKLKAGAQIFAGPRNDSFGPIKNLDNVYVALRAAF